MRATGLVLLAGALAAFGFSNFSIGEVLPDASLPGLDGKPRPWLGKTKTNVFFFFTPGQKNSELAVKEVAALEKELAGKPVTFVGIIAGTVDKAEAKRVIAETGLTAAVLVDDGDALYGKLGTALTPVVGVTDEKRQLLAYLPFTKLQYQDTMRAWIQFGLGELTKEQLDAVLSPPAAIDGGPLQAAGRYLKMAQKQFKSGNTDSALASLKRSFDQSAELAAAHALQGEIFASLGKCAEAAAPCKRALELDPANAQATAALAMCGGGADAGVRP